MNCFCFICNGWEQRKLEERAKQLREQIKQSAKQLERENQRRLECQEQVEVTKKRSEDLKREMSTRTLEIGSAAGDGGATPVKKALPRRDLSCCAGICSPIPREEETKMVLHLKQLKEDLAASQAAVQKLQVQRDQLETWAERKAVKEAEGKAPAAPVAPAGLPFAKRLAFIRGKTPAEQREIKGQIKDLLEQLDRCQSEIAWEQEVQHQAEQERFQHEATIISLEQERRNQMRVSTGLDEHLQKLALSDRFAVKAINKLFRSQTPAKQREMKQQIKAFYSELEAIEEQAAAEQKVHNALTRSRTDLHCSTEPPVTAASPDAPSMLFGAKPRRASTGPTNTPSVQVAASQQRGTRSFAFGASA